MKTRDTIRQAKEKPDYRKTAAALLARCRAFYEDEENEKAFQEWKNGKGQEDETGVA